MVGFELIELNTLVDPTYVSAMNAKPHRVRVSDHPASGRRGLGFPFQRGLHRGQPSA
jgi:hypothetical protein